MEEYAKAWNEGWQKLFDNARKEMSEKLNTAISNFERKVMRTTFKDTYYLYLIYQSLDNLRSQIDLSIGDIID